MTKSGASKYGKENKSCYFYPCLNMEINQLCKAIILHRLHFALSFSSLHLTGLCSLAPPKIRVIDSLKYLHRQTVPESKLILRGDIYLQIPTALLARVCFCGCLSKSGIKPM